MSPRNLLLLVVCAGCTRISDGVHDTVDLDLVDAPFSAHQQILRTGDSTIWAAGIDIDNGGTGSMLGQTAILMSRSHLENGQHWSSDWSLSVSPTLNNSGGSPCGMFYTTTRMELTPHPSLDVVYWAGGVFHFDLRTPSCNPNAWPLVPSVEALTSAAGSDPTQLTSSLGITIHPAMEVCCCNPGQNPCPSCNVAREACVGSAGCVCNNVAVPYDPENWKCEGINTQIRGQVPLGMKAYRDANDNVDRLLAVIPHGADAGSQGTSYSCSGSNPAQVRKHRRALAFFDLNPDGSVKDACPSAVPKLGFAAITDPAWLVDVPDTAIAASSELPTYALAAGGSPEGQVISADARLFSSVPCGGSGCIGTPCGGSDCAEVNFMKPNFMPAPPVILLDQGAGRGFVFFNRWVGDAQGSGCSGMQTSADCVWQNPSLGGGHALVLGFSLTRPATASGCTRSGASGSNPFNGMFSTPADAALTSVSLASTAGVEPVAMLRSVNYTDDNNNNGSNNQQSCTVFSWGQSVGAGNDHVPCFTDEIPYQPMALDTVGHRLVITQTGTDQVVVLSAVDLSTLATLAVGHAPVAVAVDDNNRAYVVNRDSDSLSVIDLNGPAVVDQVKVGRTPVALYVDKARPSGPLVYIVDLVGDNIAIYDPATKHVRFGPTCPRPAELFVDEVSRQAVISCKGTFVYTTHNGATEKVLPRTQSFKLLD